MIRFLILMIFMLFTTQLNAKWFNGYLINLNQDTIKCAIDIPVIKLTGQLGITSIQKKVKINIKGEEKFYSSNELKGFFINAYDGIKFQSIKINEKKILFLQVVTEGKINLYKFSHFNNSLESLPSDATVDLMFGDDIPYYVKMGDKEILYCRSLKKFLEYINDDFFNSRYESVRGHWGNYIENFVIEYNNENK